uniref:S2 self-incompatibility ribonuclease n=2 Tax=Petunia integrifolia TaxID=4103 RepID=Q7E858_PETIN|nr:S2 self-incompatibility ribonuclease precursor [Petunia integrifolia subsp. inflata]AAN11400.1 S2 self-incompatibility ribonuclease [Petunia integrifolia subsp. inflata]
MFRLQLLSALFILLFSLSPVSANFDYFQLVLTWPASFCYPKNFCKRKSNNFTIHGLWPENKHFRLEFCTGDKYSRFKEDNIINVLERHWIQMRFDEKYASTKQPLWEHEYNRHGICCKNLYDQEAYFLLAIRLKDKLDLLTTLRTHGITPGTKHTFGEIQKAIKTVTNNKDPDLKCVENIKGVKELNEIGICFNPAADSFHDCRHSKTCDETDSTQTLFRR